MSGIKRIGWHGVHGMQDDANGDYVLHSDHEAEVARLRAEVKVGEKNLAAAMDQLAETDAANARLEADVEAYRKDAERYRWLRDEAPEEWDVTRWLDNEHQEVHVQDYLDEAIDAAMGASA